MHTAPSWALGHGRRSSQLWPWTGLCWERGRDAASQGPSHGQAPHAAASVASPPGSLVIRQLFLPRPRTSDVDCSFCSAEESVRKNKEDKPKTNQSGEGGWSGGSCLPDVSRLSLSWAGSDIRGKSLLWRPPRLASHLEIAPCPSHTVWSSLDRVPTLSGKLMLA